MKRFITFAVAVLIGLAASQDIPATPPAAPEAPATPPAAPETPPAAPETPPAAPETPPAAPETPPAAPENPESYKQGEFIRRSNNLAMSWDKLYPFNAPSCKVYNSLTLFDLEKI